MTNTSERNEANLEDYTNSSFIQNLARYYSEFLATDFKKGSTPKRIFVTKDRKGRPSGVALSKYPELLAALYKKLKVQFKDQTPLKVKHQKYKSKLAPVVRTAIDKSIKGIQHDKLTRLNMMALNIILIIRVKWNLEIGNIIRGKQTSREITYLKVMDTKHFE